MVITVNPGSAWLLRAPGGIAGVATTITRQSNNDAIGEKIGINSFASFTLFGYRFYLTSTHIALLIVVILLTVLAILARRVIRKAGDRNDHRGIARELRRQHDVLEHG